MRLPLFLLSLALIAFCEGRMSHFSNGTLEFSKDLEIKGDLIVNNQSVSALLQTLRRRTHFANELALSKPSQFSFQQIEIGSVTRPHAFLVKGKPFVAVGSTTSPHLYQFNGTHLELFSSNMGYGTGGVGSFHTFFLGKDQYLLNAPTTAQGQAVYRKITLKGLENGTPLQPQLPGIVNDFASVVIANQTFLAEARDASDSRILHFDNSSSSFVEIPPHNRFAPSTFVTFFRASNTWYLAYVRKDGTGVGFHRYVGNNVWILDESLIELPPATRSMYPLYANDKTFFLTFSNTTSNIFLRGLNGNTFVNLLGGAVTSGTLIHLLPFGEETYAALGSSTSFRLAKWLPRVERFTVLPQLTFAGTSGLTSFEDNVDNYLFVAANPSSRLYKLGM